MRRFKGLWACFLAISLVHGVVADTIEEVEKKLGEVSKKVNSASYKMKMTSHNDMGGSSSKMDMTGTVDFQRKDGKFYMRSDSVMNSETKYQGGEMKMKMNSKAVQDGEFMWSLTEYLEGELKGQKMATKMKAQPDQTAIVFSKEHFDYKLLPDEKVDGKDCWVVEMTPKMKEAGDSRTVSYMRKDCGIGVKSVTFVAGKETGQMTITDIKLDASFPADHFTFKVPDGVQVQDMTSMDTGAGAGGGGEAKPAEEKPTEEKPAAEKPKEEKPKEDKPKKPSLPKPKFP
ncbi:MAG: hypothetical protein AMXMBFR47_24940 [Planctomycetota bacterium]